MNCKFKFLLPLVIIGFLSQSCKKETLGLNDLDGLTDSQLSGKGGMMNGSGTSKSPAQMKNQLVKAGSKASSERKLSGKIEIPRTKDGIRSMQRGLALRQAKIEARLGDHGNAKAGVKMQLKLLYKFRDKPNLIKARIAEIEGWISFIHQKSEMIPTTQKRLADLEYELGIMHGINNNPELLEQQLDKHVEIIESDEAILTNEKMDILRLNADLETAHSDAD